MEGRCFGVFALLLIKLAIGLCNESSEEASKEVLGEEYGQIFHSLPTLFEYILEILHQRPEILEKDDITFFQDEFFHKTCEGDEKRKRDVDTQCNNQATSKQFINKDKSDVSKRNIVVYDLKHLGNMNDVSATEGEVIMTKTNNKPTDGNGLHKSATKIKSKSKANNIKSENINNEDNANAIKSKPKISKEIAKGTMKVKKNVNFDDSFLGSIDWNKVYLTSDEVEEQTLKAEQAIEDHNRKKGS